MDIVICGVGGQGVVLASNVLATAALLEGFDVKASEVHGMAQRGGSVLSQVRIGEKVYSPMIPKKSAHIVLSFEEMEVLRYLDLCRDGATAIVNRERIIPLSVELGETKYPEGIDNFLKERNCHYISVNGIENLKQKNFPPKTLNIYLLSVASNHIPLKEEHFLKAIELSVPTKTIDVNKQVFLYGRTF
ncbi:MAG: indolepyruvate oxidoreductase subunit beta [Candidatus Aureabacteria bacterium]|nr:indolepyruvate oxidoreductase subunit beta [Candidatus Auribacterota bacterium]